MRWLRMLNVLTLSLVPSVLPGQSGCGLSVAQLIGPTVAVCVNHTDLYTFRVLEDGPISSLSFGTQSLGDGASFSVSAQMDRDPFAHFQFVSVLPSGFGPISYDAWFTTGVAPVPYGAASSFGFAFVSSSGSAAGGPGAGGVVSQGTYPSYISGSTDLGSLGVDLGTDVCQVAVTPYQNTSFCNHGTTHSAFGSVIPTVLTARLSYTHATQGTGSSTVTWRGGVDLYSTTVPEPATFWLLVAGALVLVGVRARAQSVSLSPLV